MVGVQVRTSHRSVFIVGHGLVVDAPFQLTDEITVQPDPPKLTADEAASLCAGFADYAAVITGMDLATFCLQVQIDEGGRDLAILSWNALWIFHLLSVAARSPCFSLYTVSGTDNRICSAADRSSFIRALPTTPTIGEASLAWARDHLAAFDTLVGNQQFRAAMLCYGNAHYLPDIDVRVMLLWAGIEGLLSVDAGGKGPPLRQGQEGLRLPFAGGSWCPPRPPKDERRLRYLGSDLDRPAIPLRRAGPGPNA